MPFQRAVGSSGVAARRDTKSKIAAFMMMGFLLKFRRTTGGKSFEHSRHVSTYPIPQVPQFYRPQAELYRITAFAVDLFSNIGPFSMATFITNIKFTQQGVKGIDDSTKRAAALKVAAKKLGAKVTNVYWTLGEYDGLLIMEAPDDETATTVLLHLGSAGNVHTTTCRAFTAAEMDKIVAKVHVS
jgi:uncharacterized protein with GYD domain